MANLLLIEKESSGNYAFTLTIDTVVQETVRNMFNYVMSIGDKVNFSKAEGAYLILRQNILVSDITLDDGTTVFTNMTIDAFLNKLEEIGFNDWRKQGGAGGVTAFEDLSDTFNFFGKSGQVVVVNDTETALLATPFFNYNNITQLDDVFDSIIANKMLATNKTGTRIELREIPATPAPFLTSVGSHTHADSVTAITPLVVLPNIAKLITNDSQGATTDLSNTPYGIGVLWDSVNNQFDFSSLSVGDSVLIRVNLYVTTSITNQFNKVYLTMGVGSPSEKERLIGQEHIKNAGQIEFDEEVNIVITNEDFINYPTKIYIFSDDDATVIVHEIQDIVIRKNINVVDIDGVDNTKLAILNNLSDLNNASTARTNLGLGTLATQSGTFSDKYDASNPSNYQTQAEVLSRIDDAIQDVPYDETTWNGVTDDAPSLNSVRDKFVSVDAAINAISGNVAVVKTKAEIDTLISNNDLIPLTVYLITGVDPTLYGGSDIYVQAITDNTLSFEGIGKFYNPKYNQAVSGFDVWTPSGSYTVGDKVHWGGRTWVNVNAVTGTSIDLFNLDIDWTVIPFNDTDYNIAYDAIKYDYTNDAIVYRNEQNSNIVSTSYANIQEFLGYGFGVGIGNPIKSFMWGNFFDFSSYKGIGNQQITNSYNDNINFRGQAQNYLIFNNSSYQYNLNFDNSSYQNNLNFDNNSFQYNLNFNNSSYQNNLNFDNVSNQYDLNFDNVSNQNFLTLKNTARQINLTETTGLSQLKLLFNNYIYNRASSSMTATEEGLVFQGDLPISTTATKMIVKEDNQLKEMDIPSGSGSTNLSTTYAPTTVTVVSSSGTDATIKAVDGTDAGIVTVAQKTTWDGKQDALGFTPYNATNPSGYQTAIQVQAIADAKVSNIANTGDWEGVLNTAPSFDNMFYILGGIVGQIDNELLNKQPLSAVLTATTASFTTADETKLAKYPSTATNGKILQGNGTNYVEVDMPSGGGATQSAFTVLANNTASTATPTEQVFKCVGEQTYAGIITWGTAAPTTILANTYRWQQVGKFVTAQFNFSYNTPATNSQVAFTLPTDMPTPQIVSGFTGALDIICYGIGSMFSSTTAFPTTARVSFLRRNSANTGYEFLIVQTSGSSIKTAQLIITYEAL